VTERLFTRLAALLRDRPIVLASVLDTRGATPRKPGARMLIDATHTEFSVGGGMAEARVVDAARALLGSADDSCIVDIELNGQPGAAGVCGGHMRIGLRRWTVSDQATAARIRDALAAGDVGRLPANMSGAVSGDPGPANDALLQPDTRLLVIGGGHCGAALCELASTLDFDIHAQDERRDCFNESAYRGVHCHAGDVSLLMPLLDTGRRVFAVLLNRDYPSDVRTLRVLAERPPEFIGMMGSRRRIAEVLRELPDAQRERLSMLQAPVGLDIGAQTPHEIAVSILAQLIARRAAWSELAPGAQ